MWWGAGEAMLEREHDRALRPGHSSRRRRLIVRRRAGCLVTCQRIRTTKRGAKVTGLEELEQENAELRKQIAFLEQKVAFFTNHKTLAAGISGETLISQLVDGVVTSYAASYDVVDRSGRLIEVKYSRLNTAAKTSGTQRWAWGKIFGEGGAKKFDYLILVGDRDDRWKEFYKDKSSPFVMFCVPHSKVDELTMSMSGKRYRAIQLTSNPLRAKSRAASLYKKFQITRDELKEVFGI